MVIHLTSDTSMLLSVTLKYSTAYTYQSLREDNFAKIYKEIYKVLYLLDICEHGNTAVLLKSTTKFDAILEYSKSMEHRLKQFSRLTMTCSTMIGSFLPLKHQIESTIRREQFRDFA